MKRETENRSILLQIVLLLTMTATIFLLLPGERIFRHDYKIGAPWTDENLIAPFSFPIYKSEIQLQHELDSLKKNNPLFFILDTVKIEKDVSQLREQLRRTIAFAKKQYPEEIPPIAETCIERALIKYKEYLYNGILDTAISRSRNNQVVMVVHNNEATEYLASELPEKKFGTVRFKRILQSECPEGNWQETITRLIDKKYTQISSLVFDSTFTSLHLQKQQNELSLTRGLVQEGQRIISRGDVVTEKEFLLLESLRKEYKARGRDKPAQLWALSGRLLMSFIAASLLLSLMIYFRKGLNQFNPKTVLIVLLAMISFTVTYFSSQSKSIDIYLIPFAIIPIVIRIFFDTRFAIYIFSALIIITGLILPNAYEFIFMQFIAGIVAVFSLRSMIRRSQFSNAAINVFFAYSLVYVAFTLMQEGDINKIEWMKFVWFAGNAMLILWSYPLLYLFEKSFGFMSDITLMELSDTSNPLLRKLSELAPGTFQHSLQVSNLAESVIRKIGGNPLLVYVGALYHDIGKLYSPNYFIENQAQGANPHQNLSFDASAQIIISHVEKGVELAKQHKLPQPIIDFIQTHHGNGIVHYFYRSYLNSTPEQKIDPKLFQYKGPLPQSKETAVLMIADAIEAASRSLRNYSNKNIEALVDKIIDGILKTNQLRNSDLSLRDIEEARRIFKEKLKNIYHTRIEYPDFPPPEEPVEQE